MVQLPASDLLRDPSTGQSLDPLHVDQSEVPRKPQGPSLVPRRGRRLSYVTCHVTPTRTETFFLLKFSKGVILTLWFSLHLDLCLDSALHNCGLRGRLTPHTLTRACADASSCWLPWFGAPQLSPCWLQEGPCDPLPCTSCTPLSPHCVLNLFLFPGILFPKPCISENYFYHSS